MKTRINLLGLFLIAQCFSAHFSIANDLSLDGCWKMTDGNGESPYLLKYKLQSSSPTHGAVYEISLNHGSGWNVLGTDTLIHAADACVFKDNFDFKGDSKHIYYNVHIKIVPGRSLTECSENSFREVSGFWMLLNSCRTLSCTIRKANLTAKVPCP